MKLNSFYARIRRTAPTQLAFIWKGEESIVDISGMTGFSLRKELLERNWERIEARTNSGTIWGLNRDELDIDDDQDDMDNDNESITEEKVDEPDSWDASPERWMRLILEAQEHATRAQNEAISVLVDSMRIQHERSQELLEGAHKMIMSQSEQIDRLLEERGPTQNGPDLEKLVESLAPVVAPLLLQAQTKKQ